MKVIENIELHRNNLFHHLFTLFQLLAHNEEMINEIIVKNVKILSNFIVVEKV